MKYLFVKMRRDLAGMWTQFLSVFLMAFLGILIYVGMEGTWFGMETELNSYFAETNLASAWIYGNGMTGSDLQKIKNINGVTDAALSGLVSAKMKLPGQSSTKEPDLRLNFDTAGKISKPLTVSGANFSQDGSGIWLDDDFAKANGLKTGDSLTLSIGDVQQTLKIRGLVMSSEYTYYTGSGSDTMPNHKQHGFAFIGLPTAENMMNETVAFKMQKDALPQLANQINGAYDTAREKADSTAEQLFTESVNQQKQAAYSKAKAQADAFAEQAFTKSVGKKKETAEKQAVLQADALTVQAVNREFQAKVPSITDFSFLPQYQQALSSAKRKAEIQAKAAVEKQFAAQQTQLKKQLLTAKVQAEAKAKTTVDQQFSLQQEQLSKRSAAVKKQAESTAKDKATKAILKKYDLTSEQFDAVQNLVALPKLQSMDSNKRTDTAKQLITLLKKLPDSMLSQSVGGFSLATLKQTPADYNMVRIRTDGNANSEMIEQKSQDILGSRYVGFADRNNMTSAHAIVQKASQIKKLSLMFSLLFFLLALLTMQTTMARLVDTQRIQIGTMKALGIKDWQIRGHYALYGVTVGLLGGLLGIIIAPVTISPTLLRAQATQYSLPEWPVRLTLISYVMVGAVALCCMFATLLACRKGLTTMPAETMRGAAPKAGRQILLEKMPQLWKRISFGWKWTFRDIARNKVRSFMGIIGVLGCMMLLMAGFGMQYTCNTLPDAIYGQQYTYQTKILLTSMATKDNRDALYKTYGNGQWVQETSVEYKDLPNETETLTVAGNGNFIHLRNAESATQKMPDSGILVTQRAAKLLKLQKGSKISFRTAGEKNYTTATVSDIVVTPAPQGIYISESAWEKLNKTFTPTSLLTGSADANGRISGLSYVQEVTTLPNQHTSMLNNFQPLNFIFLLLKMAAILLDVVILYNLGILSFTERVREYATLKVLGFYQKEIRSLALRENLVTSITGWLIGIPAGLLFLNVYVTVLSTSSVSMIPHLNFLDFLLATAITVGCSVCVNLFLSHRVRKIDMVGALKSVE